jgi:hypothetical protein
VPCGRPFHRATAYPLLQIVSRLSSLPGPLCVGSLLPVPARARLQIQCKDAVPPIHSALHAHGCAAIDPGLGIRLPRRLSGFPDSRIRHMYLSRARLAWVRHTYCDTTHSRATTMLSNFHACCPVNPQILAMTFGHSDGRVTTVQVSISWRRMTAFNFHLAACSLSPPQVLFARSDPRQPAMLHSLARWHNPIMTTQLRF